MRKFPPLPLAPTPIETPQVEETPAAQTKLQELATLGLGHVRQGWVVVRCIVQGTRVLAHEVLSQPCPRPIAVTELQLQTQRSLLAPPRTSAPPEETP